MSTFTQFLSGRLNSQSFTSAGTFVVPAGVDTVWVTMIGGGGSGGASGDGSASTLAGAAGGYCIKQAVNVTPGASITVSIGAGGAAVSSPSGSSLAYGNDGSATSFGALSVSGGGGGPGAGGANGATTGTGQSSSVGGKAGETFYPGTVIISGPLGGAGGLFGDGGLGIYNVTSVAPNAPANSGSGGGGNTGSFPSTRTSGAGGSGRCIVEWFT